MVYRVDDFVENRINPITNSEYDDSWAVLILTNSIKYEKLCGCFNDCVYTIKISRSKCTDWFLCVGDFIGYNEADNKNIILAMSEDEFALCKKSYIGESYKSRKLRKNEPEVLVHSTTWDNWLNIQRVGMLKSWNILKAENIIDEEYPIGELLGDPSDFRNYIMFGGGVTGEIVVNSKQNNRVEMDIDKDYLCGARLYFDAKRMAEDGLLVRDGCHIKVRDALPINPYMVCVTTWNVLGLESSKTTPRKFAQLSDAFFRKNFPTYNLQS